ncbi:MAG: hypothetical protein NZZ41_01100 [Candidatus Dojkabacteria bacterium]|nr:hypothetical protein [Candidatus Dojkabacteria bacterium]
MNDKPFFDIKDLKKVQSDHHFEFSVDLCYSGRKAFVRPLKIKDKKELLKAIESKDEKLVQKVLDEIILKYVELEDNRPLDDLTVQERYQILAEIRRAASGDTIKIVHQCPNCEHLNKDLIFDLKNIIIKPYDFNIENKISLFNGNVEIVLGPLRREEEKKIEKIIFDKKIQSTSERQFLLMAGFIQNVFIKKDDIYGEVKLKTEEKIEFFENLSSSELDKIIDYIKKSDYGVKLPFHFKCEKCSYENTQEEANVAVFFIS